MKKIGENVVRIEAQALCALADRIADARLRFFDGGHLFMLEDRSAWPAMMEFLTA